MVKNVNSHSLGIVVMLPDGTERNVIMIPEQTELPCTVTKVFGTAEDNQVSVDISIVEGESEDPEDCTEIGTLVISDLPPRPKGSKVQVSYMYNEDGRIEIVAKDVDTGTEAATQIKRSAEGLSDEEMSQISSEISRLLE